jgi:hypothetical protein
MRREKWRTTGHEGHSCGCNGPSLHPTALGIPMNGSRGGEVDKDEYHEEAAHLAADGQARCCEAASASGDSAAEDDSSQAIARSRNCPPRHV